MQILRLPAIAAQCLRVSIACSRTAIVSQLTPASGSRRRRLGRWGRRGCVVEQQAVRLVGQWVAVTHRPLKVAQVDSDYFEELS
jgi:hypothetical protein